MTTLARIYAHDWPRGVRKDTKISHCSLIRDSRKNPPTTTSLEIFVRNRERERDVESRCHNREKIRVDVTVSRRRPLFVNTHRFLSVTRHHGDTRGEMHIRTCARSVTKPRTHLTPGCSLGGPRVSPSFPLSRSLSPSPFRLPRFSPLTPECQLDFFLGRRR